MRKPRLWRKMLKKIQRKKRRQAVAIEREEEEKKADDEKKADPNYQVWLQTQTELEECHREFEEREHKMAEEAWLQREIVAQQKFQQEIEKREALKQQQSLNALVVKAAEEAKLAAMAQKLAEVTQTFEANMDLLEEYVENPQMSTPPALQEFTESRPKQLPCEIFERTNCCRYGGTQCCYNHRQPVLSRTLLLPHFFDHPILQLVNDMNHALSERDLRIAYFDFFNDVIPELEKYGVILNFRALRNTLSHMRGHVFVEYQSKRHALKAFMNLQGRFYAGKQLNVEFANLTNWRTAVCGMCALWAACGLQITILGKINSKGFHLLRKCSNVHHQCNYLHLFVNPDNKYNLPMESMISKTATILPRSLTAQTPLLSWNDVNKNKQVLPNNNWRWSESPEIENPAVDNVSNEVEQEQNENKICKKDEHSRSREKSHARKAKKHKNKKQKKKEKKKKKEDRKRRNSRCDSDNDSHDGKKEEEDENAKKSHKKHKKSKI